MRDRPLVEKRVERPSTGMKLIRDAQGVAIDVVRDPSRPLVEKRVSPLREDRT